VSANVRFRIQTPTTAIQQAQSGVRPAGFDKHYRVCRQARAGFASSPNECLENSAGLKHGVKFTCRPPYASLRNSILFTKLDIQFAVIALYTSASVSIHDRILATYYGIFESTRSVTNFY